MLCREGNSKGGDRAGDREFPAICLQTNPLAILTAKTRRQSEADEGPEPPDWTDDPDDHPRFRRSFLCGQDYKDAGWVYRLGAQLFWIWLVFGLFDAHPIPFGARPIPEGRL